CEIQKIVDDELVVCLDVNYSRSGRPLGITQPRQIRHLADISLLSVSHPNPHNIPLLVDRIAANLRPRRHLLLARYQNALATGVELKAVISTRQVLAVDLAA